MRGLVRRVRKGLWQLHAFALSPSRWRLRVGGRGKARVVVTSIPKAGTNLALRALCLHPELYRRLQRTVTDPSLPGVEELRALLEALRGGQVLATHLRYSRERASVVERCEVRHVFVVRDPRDVAVSTVFYALRERRHPLHSYFARLPDLRSRLEAAIRGEPAIDFQSAGERLEASAGWLDPPTHVVRFEDLVGRRGGGSANAQADALEGLLGFVGVRNDEPTVQSVAGRLFSGDTRTFRKGTIGQWREHFDRELAEQFQAVAGAQLVRYGYEADAGWVRAAGPA